MLTRRDFSLGASALSLAAGFFPQLSVAKAGRVMKLGNPSGIKDAQQCFLTCGRYPKLGYYEAEGIDLEFVNMSNVSQSMQTVVTGETNFATVVPVLYFLQAAKEPNLGVVAPYNWLPRNAAVLCVKPDSPYKSIADLKGKRFGIRNQGDAGTISVKVMFKELGLDDSANSYIAIGDGGPAGNALYSDRVDAIISFDTAAARVELAGFALRYLPLTEKFATISGAWFGVSRADLSAQRKAYVGLFRAVAKSTLFARTKLDQAIRIHWDLYPESKPKSKTLDEGLVEFRTILARRKDNWMRREDDPDQRMGAIDPADVKANLAIASEIAKDPNLAAKIGDVNRLFTNEIINEVNDFDRKAIVKQAQEFRL